jgi:signal transduction histidine kinase
MKTKLSNQFLRSFLVIFLLAILDTVLAFVLLSFASGWISGSLAKNRYPAGALVREDWRLIDASPVVESGGGVQVIDKDYRIVYSRGLDTFGKEALTPGEFTAFLTESRGQPYHYDILYEPAGGFWLIVTFPTSIRLDFSVVTNSEANPGDMTRAGLVIALTALVFLMILALSALVYSRLIAMRIIVPLRKLCDGTRLLREGDYSARVDLRLKNEFAELQETFNDMAARIEREISMRKRSEEDRRRLVLDISHDLKNPMTGIQGYAERLLNKPDMPAHEREEHLRVILGSSRRANRLLNDLFELSRLDSPDFALRPEKTEVCEYLRQICGELVPQLEREGFQYDFDIPEASVFAMLDGDQFSRIIQNLTSNAMRHNPKGTRVSVSLKAEGGSVVIDFCDDGSGIPPHLKESIFSPFVRADEARNSKTGGSGLGLSIAKKIATAHGGDLTLLPSEIGSAFHLTVPAV